MFVGLIMFIVDTALKARAEAGNPVRVGMIGAGFMGRGIANQIANSVPGMELVAIFNRSLDGAKRAYTEAGIEDLREVKTVADLEDSIAQGK
jgi:predicted homoserine dehydrogenase-like protein